MFRNIEKPYEVSKLRNYQVTDVKPAKVWAQRTLYVITI